MKNNKRLVSKDRVSKLESRIQTRLDYLNNIEDSPSLHRVDRWQSVVTVAQIERTVALLVTIGSLLDDAQYDSQRMFKVEIDHRIGKALYKYEQCEASYMYEKIIGINLLCAIEDLAI